MTYHTRFPLSLSSIFRTSWYNKKICLQPKKIICKRWLEGIIKIRQKGGRTHKKENLETINFLLPHAFKFFFLSDLSLKKDQKHFTFFSMPFPSKKFFFLFPKKTRNKNKQIKHRSQFKIASKKTLQHEIPNSKVMYKCSNQKKQENQKNK
jgi:hypothetical protein